MLAMLLLMMTVSLQLLLFLEMRMMNMSNMEALIIRIGVWGIVIIVIKNPPKKVLVLIWAPISCVS